MVLYCKLMSELLFSFCFFVFLFFKIMKKGVLQWAWYEMNECVEACDTLYHIRSCVWVCVSVCGAEMDPRADRLGYLPSSLNDTRHTQSVAQTNHSHFLSQFLQILQPCSVYIIKAAARSTHADSTLPFRLQDKARRIYSVNDLLGRSGNIELFVNTITSFSGTENKIRSHFLISHSRFKAVQYADFFSRHTLLIKTIGSLMGK